MWRRLTFRAAGQVGEELAVALHEQGGLGTEARDDVLVAWFPPETSPRAIMEALGREPELAGVELLDCRDEPDGAWHERWMATLSPIEAGSRFLIVPGAPPAAPPTGRIVLRLTPGRAFGTGEHATTRLCLEMLEECAGPGLSALDVGTGSGILAISAWRLGARPVVAIDTDETAALVSARNALENGCSPGLPDDGILIVAGGLESMAPRAHDIVMANLTGSTLQRLMPDLARRTSGRLILSGILRDEERAVREVAEAVGLSFLDARHEGDWCALLCRGRAHV
ncbi:MAG: 50S ribosomal protein L11 methyltransferase [Candidatus Polarisedimenticolia bacterium]